MKGKKSISKYPTGGVYREMFPNIPGVYINDPRKVRGTTGKAINPNRDLVSGYYRQDVIDSLARTAIENGIDPYRVIAQGLAETNLGFTDDNVGHVLDEELSDSPYSGMVKSIQSKNALAKRLGKVKDEDIIQAYNGYGKLMPSTEADYHGFKSKAFYGVPIPKEGLDMNKNPLYGKHVLDIQENVIKKSPKVQNIVGKYQLPRPKQSEVEKIVDTKWKAFPNQYSTGGTFLTVGDEYHRIYKNADGDIIVNHPKEDKGKWDTINLTDKADAKTVAQGVAATKKWHKENPYEDGGTINNMKKRTLKKYQYSYGGLTVTDLNKYFAGGTYTSPDNLTFKGLGSNANSSGGSKSSASIGNPEASLSDGKSSTGATVGNIAGGVGMVMPVIEGLIPDKSYTDSEGNSLGSRKSIGESALSSAASGAALGSFAGPVGTLVGGALGAGYGAVTGWMEKEKMDEAQKKANFDIQNKKLYNQMNTNVNWGNAGVNTSNNMMFPNGGMVLNYDDPNANAELELQETFQMPDGTVGNVDGPSHEMGGIAVDLPEGTRIWSDKLKYNGKTFAKHTKPITNKIARLEKEIAKSPNNSEAKENSIALLNQQLDYYFDTQETNKETNEMKRTLRQGGMIKRADGSYSKRGLWDNIRANKGSGKKPTAEMLKQERKIRANEKAMGGYMYGNGGTNNPGFRALPEEVQENILANMGMGGEMYSLGGRLMNDPMFAEGGKLPQGILQARLEAHMSPEEADAYLDEYGKGGYTVRKSSDRKGKTHVVIGPDGTKKYFGDPNLGERGKSKYGKEAFYARHKKNLAGNPYFRAYARATWEEGGMMGDEYAEGGIHIKPENKGKFTAYAKSHGKGVQEMAAHIMANKEDYSPTIVKRANFAKNAAGWKHEMGGLVKYQLAGEVGNPDRVAVGAMNPRTGQPYTMQEVASYTDTQGMLPTPFGKQYGGANNQGNLMYGNYEQTALLPGYSPKVNYAQSTLTPNNIPLKNRVQFTPPTIDDYGVNELPEGILTTENNTPTYDMSSYNPYRNFYESNSNLPKGVSNEELKAAGFGNPYQTPTPGTMDKIGNWFANNKGLVGQLGTAAVTAGSQLNRINKLARPRTLGNVRLSDRVANPNLVDYSAERNAIDRAALNAMADAQRGFGSSAAAQAFKNKARLNQLEGTGRSFQGQENANTQLKNQFLAARQEAAMREAMINNEIDKYNLENVYGFDTMTAGQKNAITAMLGNTAGQTFGKQSEYANQLNQANILANQYDASVINDMIKNGKLKMVDGKYVRARNGGTIKKRSFRK